MKPLRRCVPLLGIFALIALFFKMPEAPLVFGAFTCKTCLASEPYLPLIGAGYFTVLVALSMLFPTFPGPVIARGGLLWAWLLAITLTYMEWPGLCAVCLIGHFCNILIWTIWRVSPQTADELRASPVVERLFFTLLAPVSIVALFSCLNLTFMVYNLKAKHSSFTASLLPGDVVPEFTIQGGANGAFSSGDIAATSGSFINFISPNCPYCKEQLSILSDVALQKANDSCRFINIGSSLTPEWDQLPLAMEWFEDTKGTLRNLFGVSGYPTLFWVATDGKILKVISGVPDDFKSVLLGSGVRPGLK